MTNKQKYIIFISDLHLNADKPGVIKMLRDFVDKIVLGEKTKRPEALYILGDFFAFWIGDDSVDALAVEISQLFGKISDAGIAVYLMPGNRDFLLGEQFASKCKCTLLADPCVVDLFGVKTVLTHGDMLCTNDLANVLFRAITRPPLCKKIFLALPRALRRKMANCMYAISARARIRETKCHFKLQITEGALTKLLRKYQATRVIHGHVHTAMLRNFNLHSQGEAQVAACHISLGEWVDGGFGSVLFCMEDGSFKLWEFGG